MKKTLVALTAGVLAVGTGQVAAAPERIGSSYVLEIPSPAGMVRVGPDMPGMLRVHQATQPKGDGIRMLATYLPEQLAPAARRGEIVTMDRYCMLQSASALENARVSEAEFRSVQPDLVQKLREEGSELMQRNADVISKQGESMGRALDLESGQLKMELGGTAMLAPHDIVDGRHISWSGFMRLKADGTAGGGQRIDKVMSMTIHLALTGERLVQFTCYGAQEDLWWTRTATKLWAARAQAANP